MDIATLLGVLVAMGCIVGTMVHESGIGPFLDVPAILMVVGGSIGALFINYPMPVMLSTFRVAKQAFFTKLYSPKEVIERIVDYAAQSRRDGVLALESAIENESDPFLRRGLQLVVDGQDMEAIEQILEVEIEYTKKRHEKGAEVFATLANLAPALGLIATLIGLVAMLGSMEDPSKIGPAMAVALVGTFYGAFVANIFANPVSGKLKTRSAEEVLVKNLELEGILQIASGANPRIVEQQLLAYLAPQLRTSQFER